MKELNKEFQANFSRFSEIDKKICNIGEVAIRIGERLEFADRQREKAAEAKLLIERFSLLNSQPEMPAMMTDESKIYERVHIIKKLAAITQDLETIPGKTELGKKRVSQCSNELENRLLELFQEAHDKNDINKMKVIFSRQIFANK